MWQTVRVRGRGRATVAAYGMADAEAQVEKELGRLWPGADVQVEEITRHGPPRIVEEFEVAYTVTGVVEVEVEHEPDAPGAAFRQLRNRFESSRFSHTSWEEIDPGRRLAGW